MCCQVRSDPFCAVRSDQILFVLSGQIRSFLCCQVRSDPRPCSRSSWMKLTPCWTTASWTPWTEFSTGLRCFFFQSWSEHAADVSSFNHGVYMLQMSLLSIMECTCCRCLFFQSWSVHAADVSSFDHGVYTLQMSLLSIMECFTQDVSSLIILTIHKPLAKCLFFEFILSF